MQIKAVFFITVIFLFIGVVFLDQNSTPVPLKIVIGAPYQVNLNSIIIVSLLTGVLLTLSAYLLYKMIRKNS
jgi:hypothetical protein